MQKNFKRAFMSAMDFSIFLLSFLTIMEENVKFVGGTFTDTFFFTLLNNFIIRQITGSSMNDQMVVFIFNEVIKFLYNFIITNRKLEN